MNSAPRQPEAREKHGFTDRVVGVFLHSNLALILLVVAIALGAAALLRTPREEDPQIIVPLADVFVRFPGHSAAEVEQLVATPLEKILYQIDGVEYVYSMSRADAAVITVRFYVGADRERSLVKLYKQIDAHLDRVPPGVTGWVVKPVEIDDVPIVTLTLTGKSRPPPAFGAQPEDAGAGPADSLERSADSSGPDEHMLRRVAEECVERLAAVKDVSQAYIVGGRPRVVNVYLDPQRMRAHNTSPLEIEGALRAANVRAQAGDFHRDDRLTAVEVGRAFARADELKTLVIGVSGDHPVFLKDVADISDGPAEAVSYVRHGWGPARGFAHQEGFPGTAVDGGQNPEFRRQDAEVGIQDAEAQPAVTLALAKKKGSNAVWVARDILNVAAELQASLIPSEMQLVITRNYGLTADEKVNELVEALGLAILIVIALLTLGLGWREALIVAVAVPVVFGLTLAVNLLLGYTINRVTLFALILSLGLLVDDPIVDVENIARHFALRKRATRRIVLEAVAEIRP
ncbi:MAG: efflux RND transporter permease subunit, partial [Planctomycetota bacterium]